MARQGREAEISFSAGNADKQIELIKRYLALGGVEKPTQERIQQVHSAMTQSVQIQDTTRELKKLIREDLKLEEMSNLAKLGVIAVGTGKVVEHLSKISPYLEGMLNVTKKAYEFGIRPFTDAIAVSIQPFAISMLQFAIPFFKGFYEHIYPKLKSFLDTAVGKGFSAALGTVIVGSVAIKGVAGAIKDINTVWTAAKGLAGSLSGGISAVKKLSNALGSAGFIANLTSFASAAKTLAAVAWASMATQFKAIAGAAIGLAGAAAAVSGLIALFTTIGEGVQYAIQEDKKFYPGGKNVKGKDLNIFEKFQRSGEFFGNFGTGFTIALQNAFGELKGDEKHETPYSLASRHVATGKTDKYGNPIYRDATREEMTSGQIFYGDTHGGLPMPEEFVQQKVETQNNNVTVNVSTLTIPELDEAIKEGIKKHTEAQLETESELHSKWWV